MNDHDNRELTPDELRAIALLEQRRSGALGHHLDVVEYRAVDRLPLQGGVEALGPGHELPRLPGPERRKQRQRSRPTRATLYQKSEKSKS